VYYIKKADAKGKRGQAAFKLQIDTDTWAFQAFNYDLKERDLNHINACKDLISYFSEG